MNMTTHGGYTALVLAAQRQKEGDPLAPFCNNGNKTLIEIGGRPMLAWVIETLLDTPEINQVLVSIENPALLDAVAGFETARSSGRLKAVQAADNLFDSVQGALEGEPGEGSACPALITTADNPLLTREMVTHFLRGVHESGAEAAIAMTRAEVLRAKYPNGQRRFYDFTNGQFSNCNLYAIRTSRAIAAAEAFRHGGQFRKKAGRILKAFGPLTFMLYFLRALSLDAMGERLSRGFGVRIRFVIMPFAEACIDVDNERTLKVARQIMETRIAAAV